MCAWGHCRAERRKSSSSSAFLADAWGFWAKSDWYLERFIIPSTFTKAPVPAEEKSQLELQSKTLPPPCLTVDMVYSVVLTPDVPFGIVAVTHFTHMLDLMYFSLANCSRAWMFFLFVRKGFRLATLPHTPDIWRIREIVVTCSTQPVLARKSCSSFSVAAGLLASLPDQLSSCLLINFGGDVQFFAMSLLPSHFSTFWWYIQRCGI